MANHSDRNGSPAPEGNLDATSLDAGELDEGAAATGSRDGTAGDSVAGRRGKLRLPPLPRRDREQPRDIIAEVTNRAVTKRTPAPDDPTTAEQCPLFWDLATRDIRADNERRYLPEIALVRVSGGWAGTIRDVETSQEKRFSVVALEDLARALERAISDQDNPWLPYKNRKNPKGHEHDLKKST